jgi:GNAT superfamily N-acetyltransferase
MDIQGINFTDAAQYEWPVQIQSFIDENPSGCIITAMDNGKLRGYSVFVFPSGNEEADLRYLFVAEEYRDLGISTGMLEFASAQFKDAGISRITCTIAGDEDYIYEMSSYFMCEGFDLVIRLDHMIEYDFSEISDNKKLAPVIPHMPKEIKAEKDILEGEIRAYKNRLAQYGIKTADLTYDKDISRFYLKDGEIQNCMLFAMHDNVPEMIFTDAMLSVTDSIVTPGLLVSCVNAIGEQNADIKRIRLFVKSPAMYDAFLDLFGKPDSEFLIQVYEMTL